jgi:hypothetical protein
MNWFDKIKFKGATVDKPSEMMAFSFTFPLKPLLNLVRRDQVKKLGIGNKFSVIEKVNYT